MSDIDLEFTPLIGRLTTLPATWNDNVMAELQRIWEEMKRLEENIAYVEKANSDLTTKIEGMSRGMNVLSKKVQRMGAQ